MKAIILNSGMGTRLENLTKNNPKSMVKISDDDTIFSRAISILSKFDIDEFIITTGYLNEVLKEYAVLKFPNINFKFVHNPFYDKTNYIKSIDLIHEIDDDVILLHGDLVFTYDAANKIINSNESSIVIDSSIPIPKDDFKAKVVNNQVKYISVDYFEDDAVACQAFYYLKNEDWKIWKTKIREFCEIGNTNVYAENALNSISDELIITALDLNGLLCMEVDTKDDLKKVKEIIQ
ncbi:phosphoenolpyruvate phosphomutase [Methanobrevibacter gottschalkii]|uniref:Phosphoenolpyruvate phosphomutase n=1 Tax=Methanobrevibacter gottschalkii TaxID=190974 RepID=A0A1H7NFN9_9EURY|nr:sugar phosphate nucleotidyltransferase [Methanobrevibacter gottschalkii]SEL22264.1 phosphoenolpyruvate phosphomutase [Methanobrevibacter gottschalkii]